MNKPRPSKTGRAGTKSSLWADMDAFKRELPALIQKSTSPRFLLPFTRENLREGLATPAERTRTDDLAAALETPDLEDALYDIGRALDWTLTADARMWATHPVRDALLAEAESRGLLIVTPEKAEPPNGNLALTLRARVAHLRMEDWPKAWRFAQAAQTLLKQADPPLTPEDVFDLTRGIYWRTMADAERARLPARARFLLALPLPRPLEARLAAVDSASVDSASATQTAEEYAGVFLAPRFQAERLCTRIFKFLARDQDAGPDAFLAFAEARLGGSVETLWTAADAPAAV